MKVYCAKNGLASTAWPMDDGWSTPWTTTAIQVSTAAFLARRGALVDRPEAASLILVDLVDYLAHLAADPLEELALAGRAAGRKLVVRLHGAWRSRASDFGEPEGPDLTAVWAAADAVLVASRSHLVRLASYGGIDAERTRLAPVGFAGLRLGPELDPTLDAGGHTEMNPEERPALGQPRTHLVVAGETHRAALAPVLEMLREADSRKATYQIVSAATPFAKALQSARAVLVPATESFGDRALVDAALRAGVAVITSPGASVADAPLAPGLTVVSENGSSAAWREALEAGLSSTAVPVAPDLEGIFGRQHQILGAIDASGGSPGSHFERETAA